MLAGARGSRSMPRKIGGRLISRIDELSVAASTPRVVLLSASQRYCGPGWKWARERDLVIACLLDAGRSALVETATRASGSDADGQRGHMALAGSTTLNAIDLERMLRRAQSSWEIGYLRKPDSVDATRYRCAAARHFAHAP